MLEHYGRRGPAAPFLRFMATVACIAALLVAPSIAGAEDAPAPPPEPAPAPAPPPPAVLSRLAIGRAVFSPFADSAGGGRVTFGFTSSASQHVDIRVETQARTLVRVISSNVVPAGRSTSVWNGRTSNGSRVPDGAYRVVVAPRTAGAAPIVGAVRVDGTRPVLQITRAALTLPHPKPTSFAVPMTLTEAATVRLSTGGAAGVHVASIRLAAGPRRLGIRVADPLRLRRTLATGVATVGLTMQVQDAGGNRTVRRIALRLTAPGSTTGDDPRAAAEKMSWPLWGPITSYYGPRWGRMHRGLDVDGDTGDTIGVVADGTVTFAGSYGGYGNMVVVDHGGGVTTLYAHQSRIATARGRRVLRGQRIGYVGATGGVTGSHLHFEVRVRGADRDPMTFLALGRLAMPRSPLA